MRLVTEMDMNNQKVKENNLSGRQRWMARDDGLRLNRAFESTVLKLHSGLTPLAQSTG